MWSPDRFSRRAALLGLLALGACGLTPVYGPNGAGRRLFGRVRPRDPQTYQDFAFNRRIAERLGGEGTDYDLDYRIAVGVVKTFVAPCSLSTASCLCGSNPPSRW